MGNKSLLILAAGLSSRYGSNKQTDAMGPNGEFLMEYSIADARRAGFDRVVFVVSPNIEKTFKEEMKRRVGGMELCFAVQSADRLKDKYDIPEQRVKPYGTVHAVMCAREYLKDSFAVINADDYYGNTAFEDAAAALERVSEKRVEMIGFPIRKTLLKGSDVTRGICVINDEGCLTGINETYNVRLCDDGSICSVSEKGMSSISEDSIVSMNFFCMHPKILDICDGCFDKFMKNTHNDRLTAEYPLPVLLDELVSDGLINIEVNVTQSDWIGVTYEGDRAAVAKRLSEL